MAVVDANVVRVLARLRCLAEDSGTPAAARLHARLAGQLLDTARPGDHNQVHPHCTAPHSLQLLCCRQWLTLTCCECC